MPLYDFRCRQCGAECELFSTFDEAQTLVLVCPECGDDMRMAPSLVAPLRARIAKAEAVANNATRQPTCGHRHACTCAAVCLSRPNPFWNEINSKRQLPSEN